MTIPLPLDPITVHLDGRVWTLHRIPIDDLHDWCIARGLVCTGTAQGLGGPGDWPILIFELCESLDPEGLRPIDEPICLSPSAPRRSAELLSPQGGTGDCPVPPGDGPRHLGDRP